MSAQVLQRDQLGELVKIGQGGQGVVYRAPKVTTAFSAAMVYKEYKARTLADIDFTVLESMPTLVEDALAYKAAERLISFAAWPCRIVENLDGPTGFVMPTIPDQFFIPLTTVKGTTSTTAEFQHLLNHATVLEARGVAIDEAQRYALLREVASALAFLHGHGVCVGDISPKNLLFSLSPHEAVYFIDCDAMRIDGASALPQVQTPGWEAPAGEELATVFSDTYKLGLLALRVLVGDQDSTSAAHLPTGTPELLRQIIVDTLTNPPERRPLPQAWTYVLGHAIEHAQHQTRSPVAPSDVAAPPPQPVVHSRPTRDVPKPHAAPATAPAATTRPAAPSLPANDPSRLTAGVLVSIAVVVVALVAGAVLIVYRTTGPSATRQAEPASAGAPVDSQQAPALPSPEVFVPPPPVPAPAPVPAPESDLGPSAAELAPFAKQWSGMRENVVIDSTGHGRYDYRGICASCSMAEIPYYTLEFELDSVSSDTATGSVVFSSDPQRPVGDQVEVVLASDDTMTWSVGGQEIGLYCGSNPSYCGG